jgi:hypothetical protein
MTDLIFTLGQVIIVLAGLAVSLGLAIVIMWLFFIVLDLFGL